MGIKKRGKNNVEIIRIKCPRCCCEFHTDIVDFKRAINNKWTWACQDNDLQKKVDENLKDCHGSFPAKMWEVVTEIKSSNIDEHSVMDNDISEPPHIDDEEFKEPPVCIDEEHLVGNSITTIWVVKCEYGRLLFMKLDDAIKIMREVNPKSIIHITPLQK